MGDRDKMLALSLPRIEAITNCDLFWWIRKEPEY